ncbi:MAG: hypothetical protein HOY79_34270 [Streptomyces sp.]|nr:hypothetical protein [Streptomyces sp.]NUS11376.1 hypothetical protein [Streptomyces sp.]NUS23483.1 hypothetical protein [Streptomyces sp.]
MRGRGQPPKITPGRYPELLALLRSGLSMPATARKLNVARSSLYNLATRDPEMGAAMDAARAAARAAKAAAHTPSESCYVNNECRSDACTQAATEARAGRRARETARTPAPAAVLPGPAAVTVYDLLADDVPFADTA